MGAVFQFLLVFIIGLKKLTGVQYSEFLSSVTFLDFFCRSEFNVFSNAFFGVAGMPRRIPDYPDAFYILTKLLHGVLIFLLFLLIIFALVLVDAFFSKTGNPKSSLYS
jgi:cytochrome c oxidase subunit 1